MILEKKVVTKEFSTKTESKNTLLLKATRENNENIQFVDFILCKGDEFDKQILRGKINTSNYSLEIAISQVFEELTSTLNEIIKIVKDLIDNFETFN